MKVIRADVQDDIIFNTIEDVDTGIVTGISSVLTLPTGNLNNILIQFNFINKKIPQELRVLANFNINEKQCIDVPLEEHTVDGKTYENACYIPVEVFLEPCYFMLGLYGFKLDDNDGIKQRISLIPLKNIVVKGSYEPDAKESIVPTPTAFEIYFNKVFEANEQMQENLETYNKTLADKYKEVSDNMDNKYNQVTKNIDDKFAETNSILEEKLMFIKTFTSTYTTTAENETDIPINIDVFNELTPLEVEINGISRIETTDYTIDYENKKIILVNALDVIGTPVHFKCLKTAVIDADDYELLRGPKGDQGKDAVGLPTGGSTGQVLSKQSDTDGDTVWKDIKSEIYNSIFPVGYTFIDTVGTTDYSNHLGFTWEKTLQGVTPIGLKTNDSDFGTIAKTGGAKTVTLTKANLPSYNLYSASHTHTFTGTAENHNHSFTGSASSHSHNVSVSGGYGSGSTYYVSGHQSTTLQMQGTSSTQSTSITPSGTVGNKSVTPKGTNSGTTITVPSGGSGTAVNKLPPYQVVTFWTRIA